MYADHKTATKVDYVSVILSVPVQNMDYRVGVWHWGSKTQLGQFYT